MPILPRVRLESLELVISSDITNLRSRTGYSLSVFKNRG